MSVVYIAEHSVCCRPATCCNLMDYSLFVVTGGEHVVAVWTFFGGTKNMMTSSTTSFGFFKRVMGNFLVVLIPMQCKKVYNESPQCDFFFQCL